MNTSSTSTSTAAATPWTYQGYWNIVVGRSAAACVREFGLADMGHLALREWLSLAEAEAWRAGGESGAMPVGWGEGQSFHESALDWLYEAALNEKYGVG